MYEGLVKQLRYCATHDCEHEGVDLVGCTSPYDHGYEGTTSCNDVLQMKAADAIEELSKSGKRGRWIKPVPGDGEPYCSECKGGVMTSGGMFPYYLYTNFCPSCGAEMQNASVLMGRANDGEVS